MRLLKRLVTHLRGHHRCPHDNRANIFGDEIRYAGWKRSHCLTCGSMFAILQRCPHCDGPHDRAWPCACAPDSARTHLR